MAIGLLVLNAQRNGNLTASEAATFILLGASAAVGAVVMLLAAIALARGPRANVTARLASGLAWTRVVAVLIALAAIAIVLGTSAIAGSFETFGAVVAVIEATLTSTRRAADPCATLADSDDPATSATPKATKGCGSRPRVRTRTSWSCPPRTHCGSRHTSLPARTYTPTCSPSPPANVGKRPLFATESGRRLDRAPCNDCGPRLGKATKIVVNTISLHSLRHVIATLAPATPALDCRTSRTRWTTPTRASTRRYDRVGNAATDPLRTPSPCT